MRTKPTAAGLPAPEIKIVRGNPSGEELAALIVVLAGLAQAGGTPPPVARRAWADPAHRLRAPLRPGAGAWRTSLRMTFTGMFSARV